MEDMHVIVLRDIQLASCSIYDLMRHLDPTSSYSDQGDTRLIYPLHIALDEALLTKRTGDLLFPEVGVQQQGTVLTLSCTCANRSDKLCVHQIAVLDAVLKQNDLRLFFDARLRDLHLRSLAKGYGLENEMDMDRYFELRFEEGRAQVFSRNKELLRVDQSFLKDNTFNSRRRIRPELQQQSDATKWVLVISRHRFYEQLNFLLYEVERSQQGKLKNPLVPVDIARELLRENTAAAFRFLTALLSYQNRFESEASDTELLALQLIASNPLGLGIYYHDRARSESISAKSLFPVKLTVARPELKLKVLRKEPFYEVSSALTMLNSRIPIADLSVKNECLIFFKQQYIYVHDPDLMRVVQFLKNNNEVLLIHSSKYEAFVAQFLEPIADYVQVEYSYIHQAAPVQLEEQLKDIEQLIYLQKEGAFIAVTPVVRYGNAELPVYSRRQLYETDAVGNKYRVKRDVDWENKFTAAVLCQHPDFEEQLQYAQYFYLHKDKFFDDTWFLSAFEAWRKAGITILGFQELNETGINPNKGKVDIKINSGKDWFNVHVKIDFGGQVSRVRQIQRAFKNKSKFVQLDDGSMGLIPEEWVNRISRFFSLAHLEKELLQIPKIRVSEATDLFEREVLSAELREELDVLQQDFLACKEIPRVVVPVGLQASLRTYQQEGFDWLCFLDRFGFGACLADDMGLGKTVQVIAFLLYLKETYGSKPSLVVLPTSLLFNWVDELARFAPDLRVCNYNGVQRKAGELDFSDYDVVLLSYGVLSSTINSFKKQHFKYVVLDEAQLIKNPNSERYKTVCLLKSDNRLVLTGTPIENSTFDIYGLLSFACPGLLGNKQFFKDTYATPIDQFDFRKRAAELEQRIAPFILRRTKQQVLKELPEKTETIIYCEMNAAQRGIYSAYEEEVRNYITKADAGSLDRERLHILAALTRLRQLCNSPALLQEGYSADHSVKIDVLMEQILTKKDAHKIAVFSQFVGMLDLIRVRLEQKNVSFAYLTGQSKDRKAIVSAFQEDNSVRVFLVSLKAGGLGLNLTGADYVFLVDPWWNPAVEQQAIDRAYRIGQHKKVTAVRLICTNTIEEKIAELKQRKQNLANDLINTDTGWYQDLSKQDLLRLVTNGDSSS